MKRTRTLIHLAIAVAAICLSWSGVLMTIPVASADPLGNGYDVKCTQSNGGQATCVISGCPRVHEDLAGDVVHTKVNGGEQSELGKSCGNTTTETVNASSGFTYSVQGCRKQFGPVSDLCGAWSDYAYTPPAPVVAPKVDPPVTCPAGSTTDTVPAGQQCVAKEIPPVQCPPGSTTPTVPAGQSCTAIPAPTNAVTMNISVGIGTSNVDIASSADIAGSCSYDATSGGLPGVHKKFDLAPNGSTSFTVLSPPVFTTYHVVLSCKGPFNGKTVEFGHAEQDVTALG